MEPSVWRFVLFVVTLLVWTLCCYGVTYWCDWLIKRNQRISTVYVILSVACLELLTYAFLILFIFIFTGSGHLELFAALIAVTAFGYVAAEFMWLLVCPSTTSYLSFALWSKSEMGWRFPKVSGMLQFAGILPPIIYAVWLGNGYFGGQFETANWEKYLIKVTLLGLIGLAWLFQLPNLLYVMISRYTESSARVRIVLNQFAQTPSTLLLVSVFLWTNAAAGNTRALFGAYFVFAPTIAYFVAGYVALFLVLPFIVGHFRTKAWVNTLVERRSEFSRRLADQLRQLNVANAIAAITALRHEMQTDIAQLQLHPRMQLANVVTSQQTPATILLSFAFADIRKYDPLFIHQQALDALISRIDDVNGTVYTGANDKERREILCAAADAVDKHAAANPPPDIPSSTIIILLSAMFSGVASPVIASVGKWLATQLGLPD